MGQKLYSPSGLVTVLKGQVAKALVGKTIPRCGYVVSELLRRIRCWWSVKLPWHRLP